MKMLLRCVVLLFVLVLGCARADQRPGYPFSDNVPPGSARHHIIPWEELVDFGNANFTSDADRVTLIRSIVWNKAVNMGPYTTIEQLVAALRDTTNSEAVDVWHSLLAWPKGNLVIGPNERPDDPGRVFDVVAYECLKMMNPDQSYTRIFADWMSSSVSVWQKKQYFLRMGEAELTQATGSSCWRKATQCR